MPKQSEAILHQAAAMLQFLEKNDFKKVAKKLEEKLIKDYGKIPKDLDGEWTWTEYETESSEEEQSSSEEEESSSSDEEEMEDLEDEDEFAGEESAPPPRSLERSQSLDDSAAIPSKPYRRAISFSDEVETIPISPRKSRNKADLYWSKMDLQRMKMESNVEKMNDLINATGATMGLNLSSHI